MQGPLLLVTQFKIALLLLLLEKSLILQLELLVAAQELIVRKDRLPLPEPIRKILAAANPVLTLNVRD